MAAAAAAATTRSATTPEPPSPVAAASTEATADGLWQRDRVEGVKEVASQQSQQEKEVRRAAKCERGRGRGQLRAREATSRGYS